MPPIFPSLAAFGQWALICAGAITLGLLLVFVLAGIEKPRWLRNRKSNHERDHEREGREVLLKEITDLRESRDLARKSLLIACDQSERLQSQATFLESALDRTRGPNRVTAVGIPKKRQGPANMRALYVTREEAAQLVPGVGYNSVGAIGHFEWGADIVHVYIRDDKTTTYAYGTKREDW